MHNKADCFKIKKIKRKSIRQFEQRYSVEPKGFEMNQSMGTFLRNQNFLQICGSRRELGPRRLYHRTSKVVQENDMCLIKWKKGQNALVLQGYLMIC